MKYEPKKTKFYVAGKFERRNYLTGIAEKIIAHGGEVTSTWLEIKDSHIDPTIDPASGNSWAIYMRNQALFDLADLEAADMVVADLEDAGWGTQFELGYAYYGRKRVALIGEKRTVFHWLPGFLHFNTWEEFFDVVMHARTEDNPPVKGKGI